MIPLHVGYLLVIHSLSAMLHIDVPGEMRDLRAVCIERLLKSE